MSTDTRDVLDQLRFELNYLEQIADRVAKGEHRIVSPFRDNAICPNFGDPVRRHTCHECLLYDFVPESKRIEDVPCQQIVVTPQGETIRELMDAGDQNRLIGAMCAWLRDAILQLECAENTCAQQAACRMDARL